MGHVDDAGDARLVLHADPDSPSVDGLVRQRMVFFAGLQARARALVHQVAHLAVARGRSVHLLQWDVARPVFEAASPAVISAGRWRDPSIIRKRQGDGSGAPWSVDVAHPGAGIF
jgi:hypothetical protein